MDKLEAIKWLKSIKDKYIHGGDESYDSKRAEAIDCAIAALDDAVKTNADRIRAKIDTNEKLADMIFKHGLDDCIRFCEERPECVDAIESDSFDPYGTECRKCLLKWLQQPAEVDDDGKK